MPHRFDKPVNIAGKEGPQAVDSAAAASDLLMNVDWPKRGPAHRDASETCIKVIEGTRSTVDARTTFERAAREAGILVE